jgi:hypothetical protein
MKFVNENDGTASGILKARKQYDRWVLSQKPKAFNATTENAFTLANREIRNALNNILERKAPNVGVKSQLAKQSSLYKAMENLTPKAAEEANTAIGRIVQNIGKAIGIRNTAMQQLAGVIGLGGIAAGSAAFAGPAAAIGVPSFLIYKAGKFIMKPEVKNAMSKVLRQVESKLKYSTNPTEIKTLTEANNELKKYLK